MLSPRPTAITRAAEQLARDNARVQRFLNSLPARIDELMEAAASDDWAAVGRLSRALAQAGQQHGCGELRQRADQLSLAAQQGGSQHARRCLMKVVGLCGRIDEAGSGSPATSRD